MVRGVGAMMNRTRFKRFTFQPVVNPIYNIFLQFYHHDSRLAKAFPVQSVEFIREKGKISFRKYFSIGWQLTGLVQERKSRGWKKTGSRGSHPID